MKKEIIATSNAPSAVGPYSQAIKVGEFVYTAGQVGLDPNTGELVDDDVQAQAEQALKNLAAVLEAAGTSLAHVVKTTVFLRYMKDYKAVNEIYAGYFGQGVPARSAVAVAALPLGAKVEIEAVAVLPSDTAVDADEAEEDEVTAEEAEKFVKNAVGAVETAVAKGLRQLSNVLAEVQKELEKHADEASASDADEK